MNNEKTRQHRVDGGALCVAPWTLHDLPMNWKYVLRWAMAVLGWWDERWQSLEDYVKNISRTRLAVDANKMQEKLSFIVRITYTPPLPPSPSSIRPSVQSKCRPASCLVSSSSVWDSSHTHPHSNQQTHTQSGIYSSINGIARATSNKNAQHE